MIGVFDSGVGGLSVLRHIPEHLPRADILYVADQARAPYGTRSLEDVEAIAHDVGARLIDAGAATVVLACNTASAAALDSLRVQYPATRFVGMEPAVKPAVGTTETGVIGILATGATFQSERFESVVRRFASGASIVTAACPEWVALVEAGKVSGAEVEAAVRARVEPMTDAGVDTLVLGCTHFPFLEPMIRLSVGHQVRIVDPSPAVARQVGRVDAGEGSGIIRLTTTGNVAQFEASAGLLLGRLQTEPVLAFDM